MGRWLSLTCALVFAFDAFALAQETSLERQYLDLLRQRDVLAHANLVLHEEIRLSADKKPYLVVDFRAKELVLKVHGQSIKRFPVTDLLPVGTLPCVTGAAVLDQFEGFVPPVVPLGGVENLDLVVELRDMPQSYDLGFQTEADVVVVSVRPAPAGTVARARERISEAFLSGGYVAGRLIGVRRSAYRILLPPEDAQALFWVLEKGSSAILVCD